MTPFTLSLLLSAGNLRGQGNWIDDGIGVGSPVVDANGARAIAASDSSAGYFPLPQTVDITVPFRFTVSYKINAVGLLSTPSMGIYCGNGDNLLFTLSRGDDGVSVDTTTDCEVSTGSMDENSSSAAGTWTVGTHTASVAYDGALLRVYIDDVLQLTTVPGQFDPVFIDPSQIGIYAVQKALNPADMTITAITYSAPPLLTAGTVGASGLTTTFTLNQTGCIPASGSQARFTLLADGASKAISATAISGTTLTLTHAAIVAGQTVTCTYTDGAGRIQNAGSLDNMAAFSGTSLTNSSALPAGSAPARNRARTLNRRF